MKQFPILNSQSDGGPCEIPYELVKLHERQVMINHGGQTVERICERCGLSWTELYYVLNDLPFGRGINAVFARCEVLKKVEDYMIGSELA